MGVRVRWIGATGGDEAHRVGRVLYSRHDWVHRHFAEDTGTLPVGELAGGAQDWATPCSTSTRRPRTLARGCAASSPGGEPPRRRTESCAEKRGLHDLPRAAPPEGYEARKSVVGAFVDAAVNDRDPPRRGVGGAALQPAPGPARAEAGRAQQLGGAGRGGQRDGLWHSPRAGDLWSEATGARWPGEVPAGEERGCSTPLRQVGSVRGVRYTASLLHVPRRRTSAGNPMGDGTPIELHYSNQRVLPDDSRTCRRT